MVFGRKKREKDEAAAEPASEGAEAVAAAAEQSEDAATAADRAPRPEREATTGPWDLEDLPEDDDQPRIDLGGMRVPVPPTGEVRLEVSPQGQVMSAIALDRGSQIQINAFAAPRLEGIWDEVRLEIAQSLKAQGGAADEVDGTFGRELKARIPNPQQPSQSVPARFVGYDGPRWFLRGLITGPAATDQSQAEVLHAIFRNVVVVRGKDAMAPRDPLPLNLPKEAQEAAAQAAREQGVPAAGEEQPAGKYQDLDPFRRGPEISEIR